MPWLFRTAAVLAAGALLLPVPAYASGWSSPDAEGDVTGWHWDPQPEPCGSTTDLDGSAEVNEDITRLGARHTRDRLRLVARFRDLDETLEQDLSFYLRTTDADWELDLERFRTRSGRMRVMTFLARAPEEPDPAETDECGTSGSVSLGVRCAVERDLDFDTDRVTVAMPRSCVGDPRWVRVGLRAMAWDSPDDVATNGYSGFNDVWGSRPDGETTYAPPLGPRLRAPIGSQTGSPSHRSQVASSATGSRRSLVISRAGFPTGITAASAS